jgi:hypothetical protein
MTPKKILGTAFVILVIAFITSGDSFSFLPQSVRSASKTSREFLVGLVPDWLTPRDFNQQREKDVEKLEQKTRPAEED